jgi:hypothetical protein
MHSYSGPVLAASSRETKRFQISAIRRVSTRGKVHLLAVLRVINY